MKKMHPPILPGATARVDRITRSGGRAVGCVMIALLAGGCTSIGPPVLKRDRFDYADSLSKSAQEQMLLNLVRLRYVESPVFLDVTSVVNSYTLDTGVGGGLNFADSGNDSQNLRADASYTDRPTVTYSPRRGEAFTRSLLRPIPPASLVALAQAGWPVDFIFRTTINSANGIGNRFGAAGRARAADPQFHQLMAALRDIQKSGAAGIRIEDREGLDAAVFFFTRGAPKRVEDDIREVKRILKLDPGATQYDLTYGNVARNNREIAVLSRSLLEIMTDLSSNIEVPQKDIDEGRTYAALADDSGIPPLVTIKSGKQPAGEAFAKTRYRRTSFRVDGVVEYWSDSLDGAASEHVGAAGHEATFAEIRRILYLHAGLPGTPAAPATTGKVSADGRS